MLPLPESYPDELLYSLLCRLRDRTNISSKKIIEITTGSYRNLIADLTTGGSSIARCMSCEKKSSSTIIRDHTLFNYYAHTLPPDEANSALHDLCAGRAVPFRILGVLGTRDPHRMLRSCPECIADDRARFGETYWHRAHQLQGVNRCLVHGRPLMRSSCRIAALKKLTSAEVAHFSIVPFATLNDKENIVLKEIEAKSHKMLSNPMDGGFVNLMQFRILLFQIGLISTPKHLFWNFLKNEVHKEIGARVINLLVGNDVDFFRPPRTVSSPIHAAILTVFAERWATSNGIEIGAAVSEATTWSGVPTAARIEFEKRKYLKLRSERALPQKRAIGQLLKVWDLDWRNSVHGSKGNRRTAEEWMDLDYKLSRKCRNYAFELRSCMPPVWVSRNALRRGINFCHGRKILPELRLALSECAEDLDQYRKRRILYFVEKNKEKFKMHDAHAILKIAGLFYLPRSRQINEFCENLALDRRRSSASRVNSTERSASLRQPGNHDVYLG